MAPPRKACEVLKTALDMELKRYEVLKAIRDTIAKINQKRIQLRYRIVNLSDFVATDLLSAAQSMAATIASALLSNVSNVFKMLIEQLIQALVTLFLSTPQYVYMLIAIPLKSAREASVNERKLLFQAQAHYNAMNRIIIKWLSKDIGRQGYYTQMRNALIYVRKASNEIIEMIKELEDKPKVENESNIRNAYFNEARFKRIQKDILVAADITKPQSNLDQKLGISQSISIAQNNQRSNRIVEINKKYALQKKENDTLRAKATLLLNQQGPINTNVNNDSAEGVIKSAIKNNQKNISATLKQNKIDEVWASRNEAIENERQMEISEASIESSISFNANEVRRLIKGNIISMKEEFKDDMEILASSAKQYLQKITQAYAYNKASQQMSNSCYVIRDLISKLIQELIKLTREIGNKSSAIALAGLENTQAMLKVVDDKFTTDTDKFKNGESIESAKMASDVGVGHGLLIASSALLNATITDSLIKMINADDELYAMDNEMNLFMSNLELIPDWNEKKKIWAVNPLLSSMSPYLQLIADSTKASIKLILYMGTNSEQSGKAKKLITDMNSEFRLIKRHNQRVLSVLYSYEPVVGAELNSVISSLKVSGLFAAFASSMSIVSLVRTIQNSTSAITGAASEYYDTVTYKNCKEEYPDLFGEPDADRLSKGELISNLDYPPRGITTAERLLIEKVEVSGRAVNALIENSQFTTVNRDDFQTA